MAESQDDKDVDALISDLQSTLDKLKSAQGKDVKDEDSEEYDESSEPKAKNLKGAERVAYIRVRAHNRRTRQGATPTGGTSGKENSGLPESDDRLK